MSPLLEESRKRKSIDLTLLHILFLSFVSGDGEMHPEHMLL